jgi:hypothetical protein
VPERDGALQVGPGDDPDQPALVEHQRQALAGHGQPGGDLHRGVVRGGGDDPLQRQRDLPDAEHGPALGRDPPQAVEGDQAGQPAVELLDREGDVRVDGREPLHEGVDGEPRRPDDRVAPHHVAGAAVAEAHPQGGDLPLVAGGAQQEPADHGGPQAAGVAGEQEPEDAEADQDGADPLADPRGGQRRAGAVAAQAPQDRVQHAPAVQRRAGDQVEQRQGPVHDAEPQHRPGDQAAGAELGQQHRHAEEDAAERQAGERPDPGDQELQPRAGQLAADARDAPEQPEGDVLDLDAGDPPGGDGVAQLVHDQRAEEQPGGGQRGDPVRLRRVARESRGEDLRGERPGHQAQHDQDAPVEPNSEATDGELGGPICVHLLPPPAASRSAATEGLSRPARRRGRRAGQMP